jgi:hypothetical protein
MKLKLNNKFFVAKYDKNDKLIISLDNDTDILFFREWEDKSNNFLHKKDYVKNVDFVKVTGNGIIINCFPILNKNENSVELVYDTINKN